LLHLSHAVTDGVGSVELFAHIYDLERDPPARPTPDQPIPQDLSANDLMREGLNHLAVNVAKGAGGALWGAASMVGRAASRPGAAISGVLSYARSGARVMSRAAEPSPLLRRRSLATRSEAIDIPLSDLHRAAKAGGGSINDAYLAALCGALGRYHEALGVPISTLPMAVPVSLRAESDAAGGNRFTGVNLAAPIGTTDPVARMQKIRLQMTQRRDEPAMDIIGSIAPLLSILPGPLLESMTGSVVASDVQASNVPVYPGDTFLVGSKVLRQYGIGPLPGVAMMVVLISRGGYCTITARYDRAAIREEKLFATCLLNGFNEILALAGDPAPRAEPASFDAEPPDTSKRSVVGS
ncbi:MAG: diacylglycerol O-acyltransferase / wax synthase, partial [Mycobacterium sp.]|nr:diacylglycerol O-acyltransferase / wax synthase [Mycobacterium sp.]